MISAINSIRSIVSNANQTNKNNNAKFINHPNNKNNVSFGAADPNSVGLMIFGGLAAALCLTMGAGAVIDLMISEEMRAKWARNAELHDLTHNFGTHKLFSRIKKP